MVHPPRIPDGYPDVPVTPAELQAARAGVESRAGRLSMGLSLLAALTVIGSLAALAGLNWGYRALPGLLEGLNSTLDKADRIPAVDTWMPAWTMPTLLGLTLLGTALYVWPMLVARRAVLAMRDQTLDPHAGHAEALVQSARTVRPWLTLGQYLPLITSALNLLFVYVMLTWLQQFDLKVSEESRFTLKFGDFASSVVSTLVTTLPLFLLHFFFFGAHKNWLDALVTRTQDPVFPLRPFTRKLDPWLILLLIVLVMGLLILLLVGLPMTIMPSFIPTAGWNDPELDSLGFTPQHLKNLLVGAGVLTLLSGLLYGLYIALAVWWRGFSMNVAQVLDSTLPQPTGMTNADLWAGPEQVMDRRQPK